MLKVRVNPDKKVAEEIRQSLKENGWYCPCKLEKTEDTRCLCKDFREQTSEGYCHCGLYYKEEVEE